MKRNCIKVFRKNAEALRRALIELKLLDNSYRICPDGELLCLPITRVPEEHELALLPGAFTLAEHDLEVQKGKPRLADLMDDVPHFEVVGDIAIIEDDVPEPETFAGNIMKVKPNVRTVLASLGPVEGEFRTRRFRTVAGEDRTSTIHKEYGCLFSIDLEKAYFTPRLATERARIAAQVNEGQTIVDMFAGVGPYSIMIAKKDPSIRVIAIDKNPDAVIFLRQNIRLNSVSNIEAIEGDANIEALRFKGQADHVIMNLPHNACDFLDAAITLCAPGAIIHFYDISSDDDLFHSSQCLIDEAASRAGRKLGNIDTRVVRSYAPHQHNVCIEVEIL